jgi:acyl-CoA synthetase (NDP forming)
LDWAASFEALRDVAFRLAPVSEADALDMMCALRGAKILDGMRGSPRADRGALAQTLRRVGQLAVDCPDILELDVNPLLARESGLIALDARIRIQTPDG